MHSTKKKFSCLNPFLSSYLYNSATIDFDFSYCLKTNKTNSILGIKYLLFLCNLIIGIVATRLYDIKSLLLINFPLTTQIVKICESLGQ